MKKIKNKKKKYKVSEDKIKHITAQAVFTLLSLLLVPVYTIVFGTKESPWEFTLSNIGNFFTHRFGFIIWGILTGMGIAFYTLYLYEKMDFSDKKARRYLISSVAFLSSPAIAYVWYMCEWPSIVFTLILSIPSPRASPGSIWVPGTTLDPNQ